MADGTTFAALSFVLSIACCAGAFYFSKKYCEEARAEIAQLSSRSDSISSVAAEVSQKIALIRSGLEKKITRNAMQSITKQAKDITSAVIGGS